MLALRRRFGIKEATFVFDGGMKQTGHDSDGASKTVRFAPEPCPDSIGTLSGLHRNSVRLQVGTLSGLRRNTQSLPVPQFQVPVRRMKLQRGYREHPQNCLPTL